MVIKFLALAAVLVTIYLIFFKTSRKDNSEIKPKRKDKKKQNLDGDTMIECSKCSTFISTKEAIIKDGKFYCSKECAYQ